MDVRWYTTSKYSSRSTAVSELRNSNFSSGSSLRKEQASSSCAGVTVAASGSASSTAAGNICSMRCAISRPVMILVTLSPFESILAPGVEEPDQEDKHEREDFNEACDCHPLE